MKRHILENPGGRLVAFLQPVQGVSQSRNAERYLIAPFLHQSLGEELGEFSQIRRCGWFVRFVDRDHDAIEFLADLAKGEIDRVGQVVQQLVGFKISMIACVFDAQDFPPFQEIPGSFQFRLGDLVTGNLPPELRADLFDDLHVGVRGLEFNRDVEKIEPAGVERLDLSLRNVGKVKQQ